MTNTRAITLGMGYDTLQGAGGTPKGVGAIMKIAPSDEKKISEEVKIPSLKEHDFIPKNHHLPPSNTPPAIEFEETGYDILLISDYLKLSKALELNCTGGAFGINPKFSLEARFFEKVELSKQTLSLFIKSQTITKIKHISPNSKLSSDAAALLKRSQSHFIEVFGDEYVSEIRYGKKLYVLIQYINANESDLNEIKLMLQGNLGSLGIDGPKALKQKVGLEIKMGIDAKKTHTYNNAIADIKLAFSGVKLDTPDIGSNIEELLAFISEYNKKENLKPDTIIGFSTKPYVTACTTFFEDFGESSQLISSNSLTKLPKMEKRELLSESNHDVIHSASQLRWRMTKARLLLEKCDYGYQKLRLIIPTIEKLTNGVKKIEFKNKSDVKNVMEQLLVNSQQLFESISIIAQKIYEHKVNPSMLKRMVNHNKYKMPLKELNHSESKLEHQSLSEIAITDELDRLISDISHEINSVESVFDLSCQGLSTKIACIPPATGYFHLARLPSVGARVLWTIQFEKKMNEESIKKESKEIEEYKENKEEDYHHIKFNLKVKKYSPSKWSRYCCGRKSYQTEYYYDICHGDAIRLTIRPQDCVKIKFINPKHAERKDFNIVAQVTGPQIFDLMNYPFSTTWVMKSVSEINPIPLELQPQSFYFSMDEPKKNLIKRKPFPASDLKIDPDESSDDEHRNPFAPSSRRTPLSPSTPVTPVSGFFSISQSARKARHSLSRIEESRDSKTNSSSISSTHGATLISSSSSSLLSNGSITMPISELSSSLFSSSSSASQNASKNRTVIHPLSIASSSSKIPSA